MTSRHAVGFDIPNLREERAPRMAPAQPEVVEVVLAPFSGTPKMSFEDVQIGSTVKQYVNLRNPLDSMIKVMLLIPKDLVEYGLSVSSMEFEIPSHEKVTLEITFQPTKVVSSHHTVKVVDPASRRQKGQFQLTCVSVFPTKQGGKKRKVWDKQPHMPVFGADRPVLTSAKAPAAWARTEHSAPVGDSAALNPPDDTTFTLSPAANPINATYICPNPAEAKGATPNFEDSLENVEPRQLASNPSEIRPANPSRPHRHLVFESEYNEKENHMSPKKRRTANISFSEIGFESLTPDHPAETRGPLKSMENMKNSSFSSLNFSTPDVKKVLEDYPVRSAKPQDRGNPAVVGVMMEPISPEASNENTGPNGPPMTPNFKAPFFPHQNEILVNRIAMKPEPVTPIQPIARVEFFSPRRSIARGDPITPRQQVAKIEPLQLSRVVSKVEALTPVPSSSKPLLSFEMSPPTQKPFIVRKELFGGPHVTSTPMEARNGKPCTSQRKHLSPKSLTSFKKKNVRVYMPLPTPTPTKSSLQCSAKAGPSAVSEDPAHTLYQQPIYNLDIYGTTTMADPFARNAIHPLEYQDKQARELIKWVNSVLTLPEEYSEVDAGVDVVALWKKSNASDTFTLPASRETVCSKYHKNELHLYNLRKSARLIFQSKEMTDTLYQVHAKINTGYISVKDDIDLHSDQGVRCHLVQLLMHYNPLWLRIGLEAIYGRNIQVQPKRPSLDLIIFIKNNFLSDKYITERNSYNNVQHYRMPKFKKEMNDYIIFKYLSLIFFLDVAKKSSIIPYDPCLFKKESPIKESEGMLNEFIKEFIKCVSHMKKTLASWGYTLTHKQTAIDEYNFAVHSHLDLRDGASLTRLMEVILIKKQLIRKLRLPAISRLQKIHNVKVAFAALEEEKVQLVDVEPKDVVDAHKEKIMSLLWQILHKFLKPRLENAAIVIQIWWRKQSLKVEILRRIRKKKEMKKKMAAAKIQALWKGYRLRKCFPEMRQKLIDEKNAHLKMLEEIAERAKNQTIVQSAVTIQQWFRATMLMRKERSEYVVKRNATIAIQKRYRSTFLMKKERLAFEKKRSAAVSIQLWYRACAVAKKQRAEYKCMLIEQREYQVKSNAAIKIQEWYRATVLMRKEHSECAKQLCAVKKIQEWYRATALRKKVQKAYGIKLNAAVEIQRWFRATALMKKERGAFEAKRKATIKIQQWYRASALMKKERGDFEAKRKATIKIQQWYRATALMKKGRMEFEAKRAAAVKLQNWYRSAMLMRKEQTEFDAKRTAAIKIQQWFRATALMMKERTEYESKRTAATKLQTWYRSILLMRKEQAEFDAKRTAAIKIQQWFRATALMKKERTEFESKRTAATKLQTWYRSILLMRKKQAEFDAKRTAAIKIQQWFRATALMKKERTEFESKRTAATKLQTWYRSILLMRKEQAEFDAKRTAAIKIQQWFRATALMKKERTEFESKRTAATKLQTWYRSILLMRKKQAEFDAKRTAAIKIQQWFRATALMKKERTEFESKRTAATKLQTWYRSILLMRKEQAEFDAKRTAVVKIQQWFRATALMKKEHTEFESKRTAATKVQTWYRSFLLMRKEQAEFETKRKATITIQQWFRATVLMKKEHLEFEAKRAAAVKVQNWYRSVLLMRQVQAGFETKKKATIKIQQWFRATALMKKERMEFEAKRAAAVKVQNWYRSVLFMRRVQAGFETKKKATIKIQQWYRATAQMKKEHIEFEAKKSAAIKVQNWYRSILHMRKEQAEFEAKREAAIKIQQWCRATMLMREERTQFKAKQNAVIKIQRFYRATALMKAERKAFLAKRAAALRIQQLYRATVLMKKDREVFLTKHNAAIKIQQWFRATALTKKQRAEFKAKCNAIIRIQRRFRATALMKKERDEFEAKLNAVIKVQQRFRARTLMKKEMSCYKANRDAAIKIWMRQERQESDAAANSAMLQALAVEVEQTLKDACRGQLAPNSSSDSEASCTNSAGEPDRSAENAASLAQQAAAAKIIQDWYRSIQLKRRVRQINILRSDAAIKIQRSYRAYRERVAEASARSKGEDVKPKQLSIGENYENAIAVILSGSNSFHYLFVSFKNIDFALTHSTGLCERMVQSENSYEIVRAIYRYLSAENRSEFYQTVFDVAMSVILEAISYQVTYNAVWEHTKNCDGIDIILQFMGKFLEKGEPLFCKAATILWAFTRTPQQIAEIISNSDCKERLNYYDKKVSSKASGQRPVSKRNAPKPVVLPSLKRNGGYDKKSTKRTFSTRLEALTVLKKTFS